MDKKQLLAVVKEKILENNALKKWQKDALFFLNILKTGMQIHQFGPSYKKNLQSLIQSEQVEIMQEIKPCPFCRATTKTKKNETGQIDVYVWVVDSEPEDYYVNCRNCDSRGPMGISERIAIKKWNKRVGE